MFRLILNEIDFFKVRLDLNFNKLPTFSTLITKILTHSTVLLIVYTFYELAQPVI